MLNDKQIESFQEQSYLVVPGVVDLLTVQRLRAAHDDLLQRWSAECGVTLADYERVVSQWTSVHEQHPAYAAQLHHPRVVAIARQLLAAPRIQLFHDHLISKPPKVSETIPWHQDYPFWPIDRPHALSCWLALDDADTASGAMSFMPAAHLEGECAPVDFLRKPKDWGARECDKVATAVRAGDCIFHSCLSWHCSPPNQSAGPRRAFIAIMMAADCRYAPEHSGWHPMNACVSVAPGEPFNSDRFPVLGDNTEVAL